MKSAHKGVLLQLDALLRRAKTRKLLEHNLQCLPWIMLLSLGCWYLAASALIPFFLMLGLLIGAQWLFRQLSDYKALTTSNLLTHMNSRFPELENSSQLLLPASKPWSLLQVLQKQKVLAAIRPLLKQPTQQLLPPLKLKAAAFQSLLVVIILLLIWLFTGQSGDNNTHQKTETIGADSLSLLDAKIIIAPPAYTGQQEVQSDQLDISLIAGSKVTWELRLSAEQSEFYLQLADGSQHEFVRQVSGTYSLSETIKYSGIYHFGSDKGRLEGLYTLSVIPDRPPTISVLQPQRTITEIPKNIAPKLLTKVAIEDDFGLSQVDIQASIAKGSGEAVKFRDQTFSFDHQEQENGKSVYIKDWDLISLGMEPGDELYFTVRAWDNRQPDTQLSQSRTKIIRWLEEEQTGILSDGILIDFMPEYFKSQRQIIIETIELIERKPGLSKEEIDYTSRGLGIAQSDLKQKYGQYLGDEFDHGVVQQMEDGVGHPEIVTHDSEHGDTGHNDEVHTDDDHDEHTQEKEAVGADDHHSHGHEAESHSGIEDKSGAAQMIEKFGHAHGDTDIGILNQYNPKAMMKRSIANMWQAELHLMLSEPEKALPYENEALKYLNLAKKAERIYVKRLGFEPPPVTEKRRFQGDLSDILSYQQRQTVKANEDDQAPIIALLKLLNTAAADIELNEQQLELIQQVKLLLIDNMQTQQEGIRQVATLEQMQLNKSLRLVNCEHCTDALFQLLWTLLSDPIAIPVQRREAYSNAQPSVVQYGQQIKALQQTAMSNEDQGEQP